MITIIMKRHGMEVFDSAMGSKEKIIVDVMDAILLMLKRRENSKFALGEAKRRI